MDHFYPSSIGPAIRKQGAEVHERAFLGIASLLFIASVAGTIYWCGSMDGGMPMPGGWIMSMAWMRMPGQSWPGMIASFLGMWTVMMIAMMLPSLTPMLSSYRNSLRGRGHIHLGRLTLLAGAGYFFLWTVFGVVALALGTSLVAIEMQWPALSRSVPIATGVVLLLAGCVQLTHWKARQLGRCRDATACGQPLAADGWTAWQHGLRLGVHCNLCCSGFMIVLLVVGVMNLSVMAILAVAITLERLTPRPKIASRAAGFVAIAGAILLIVQATNTLP